MVYFFEIFEIQDNFEQIQDNGHFAKIQECPLKKHADGHPDGTFSQLKFKSQCSN